MCRTCCHSEFISRKIRAICPNVLHSLPSQQWFRALCSWQKIMIDKTPSLGSLIVKFFSVLVSMVSLAYLPPPLPIYRPWRRRYGWWWTSVGTFNHCRRRGGCSGLNTNPRHLILINRQESGNLLYKPAICKRCHHQCRDTINKQQGRRKRNIQSTLGRK